LGIHLPLERSLGALASNRLWILPWLDHFDQMTTVGGEERWKKKAKWHLESYKGKCIPKGVKVCGG
jgi:hypothetical protein